MPVCEVSAGHNGTTAQRHNGTTAQRHDGTTRCFQIDPVESHLCDGIQTGWDRRREKGAVREGFGSPLVLTKLKAEVLSDTPAELIMSSATEAFSAGSFGARNGSVGKTRTSYFSSAA
jgi:hypothetical protein